MYFRKSKIIFGLYKRGDIDLETIKRCRRVSDRQSIGNRPNAMENRILQSRWRSTNDDTARYYLLLTSYVIEGYVNVEPIQF